MEQGSSKTARSVDPCPLCSEIRAALIWARQTLNEAKFVLLATEKHKVKEMCVAYFQARALIKKYPRLAAINCQREKGFCAAIRKAVANKLVVQCLRATFWGTVEAIKMPAGRRAGKY